MSITGGSDLHTGLPSPQEVALPPECDGWEDLYPPHVLFAEDRSAYEDSRDNLAGVAAVAAASFKAIEPAAMHAAESPVGQRS